MNYDDLPVIRLIETEADYERMRIKIIKNRAYGKVSHKTWYKFYPPQQQHFDEDLFTL